MASWCANCSGATVSLDRTQSVDLSLAMEVGELARRAELDPTVSSALTRTSSDADLWQAVMGDQDEAAYPAEAMILIRDLFDGAWSRTELPPRIQALIADRPRRRR